jgi:hypothetical protein
MTRGSPTGMSRAGPSRKTLSKKKGWTKVVKEAIALVGIVCQENRFVKNLLHPLRVGHFIKYGFTKIRVCMVQKRQE